MVNFNSTLHLSLALVLLLASVAVAGGERVYRGYETPPYRVLSVDGAVELRAYDPHIVAEVRVEGPRSTAVARGFRTLARFIFGANAESQKIAMTAPVNQLALPAGSTSVEGPVWDVQFMMPAQFSLESLPAPNHEAIRFTVTAPERQAVIRFSGFWSDRLMAEKTAALQAWMADQGLTAAGPPRYYFYDDPFTLPFRRRNEIAFVIAPSATS